MKKIVPVLLAMSIIMLLPSIDVFAYTDPFVYNNVIYMPLYLDTNRWVVISSDNGLNFYQNWNGEYYLIGGVNGGVTVTIYQGGIGSEIVNQFGQGNYQVAFPIIQVKGTMQGINDIPGNMYYPSLDDYLNPYTPWYQEMWDTLKEELGNPDFWFGEWFIDLIDNVFGNDEGGGPSEHSITTHVQIENPTLTPAPIPIPYTTIVIPKTDPLTGDTYYETNYYYNNPSGTPIVQPYPPTNPPSTNTPPNGSDYIPISGDPYSIPVVNWLTSTTIGDTNYDGIDSVGSGLDSIDSIGSEYNNGMSAVQDATGTLPTSWLLLIGIAAAIPLIAGIVSRFLS